MRGPLPARRRYRRGYHRPSTFCEGTLISLGCEQAEDADACGGADINFAIGDHGGDEFVAVAEMVAAAGGLVAVVKLIEVVGVVGVEDGGAVVLRCPDDAVG